MGGDITGKMVIPIVQQTDETWEATFIGNQYRLKNEQEILRLVELINRAGSYPYRTNVAAIEHLQATGERERKVEALAQEMMEDRLREWMTLAEQRMSGSDAKIFFEAGNDDPFVLDSIIAESSVVVNPDHKVVRVDDHHEMIGMGHANITPWNCPRDVDEDELRRRIDDVVAGVEDVSNSIFCVHAPPINSQLDTCFKLDSSVYPPKLVLDAGGQPVQFGAGSRAVLEAIQTYQPLVGLHGHIHESRGTVKIGRTEAFNPGSEYSEGILRGLILNLTEDAVLSYQFTSG